MGECRYCLCSHTVVGNGKDLLAGWSSGLAAEAFLSMLRLGMDQFSRRSNVTVVKVVARCDCIEKVAMSYFSTCHGCRRFDIELEKLLRRTRSSGRSNGMKKVEIEVLS